jgi:hypothetical protein
VLSFLSYAVNYNTFRSLAVSIATMSSTKVSDFIIQTKQELMFIIGGCV